MSMGFRCLDFPNRCYGHYCLVKIIKIIVKIKLKKLLFVSLQYLVLYVCYFIYLPSRISESNKI